MQSIVRALTTLEDRIGIDLDGDWTVGTKVHWIEESVELIVDLAYEPFPLY